MLDEILGFADRYLPMGMIFLLFLAFVMLWKMYGQLKRLNHNLNGITGNMQKYFQVILEEEPEDGFLAKPKQDVSKEERFLTKEEKEMLLSDGVTEHWGDEKLFNEIMQEYFS